jgi:UDP-2,3-diacylglucosamine pyrophosphatase LpxH
LRRLPDDTLIVFLSDTHIGGDDDRDIFETPDDLASLFEEISAHPGPVELVLAGDFFDFLRISEVPDGLNRAAMTTGRPEYGELFSALRRLAAGERRTVVYLPGNHDAEMWWNPEIQAELRRKGLVHEFALSYAAAFEGDPRRIVYCEHGNQFDPANAIHDYTDPLDTPLGHHIVTDLAPYFAGDRRFGGLSLREIDRVFPLTTLPDWASGRLFHRLVSMSVRYLLLPVLIAFAVYQTGHAIGTGDYSTGELILQVGYDIAVLLMGFGLILLIARRLLTGAVESTEARFAGGDGTSDEGAVEEIGDLLVRGKKPPLSEAAIEELCVFVSGHTHAPSLHDFQRPGGGSGAVVNSGCWLRQLQPVPAHLRGPPVFVSRFVQTHVRVRREEGAIAVELWEHPRPFAQRLSLGERLAIAGRRPAEVDHGRPDVRERATVRR